MRGNFTWDGGNFYVGGNLEAGIYWREYFGGNKKAGTGTFLRRHRFFGGNVEPTHCNYTFKFCSSMTLVGLLHKTSTSFCSLVVRVLS